MLMSSSPALAQSLGTVKLDSFETPNDGAAGPVTLGQPLAAGQSYAVTVSGTWSAWLPANWNRDDAGSTVCGTPEDHPVTPSRNRPDSKVGQDSEWLFARPWKRPCSGNRPNVPYTYTGFQINAGTGFTHVTPSGGSGSAPAGNHSYTYIVQGTGVDPQFELRDSSTTDNNGVLTISVAPVQSANSIAPQVAAPSRSCTATGGFLKTDAKRRAHGARLLFARKIRRRVNIDVFQTSVGRRVIGERLVARYRNLDHSLNWSGVANRPGRKVTDGYYFVRYRMTLGNGIVDTRRVTLRRVRGHFTKRPSFYRRASCGLLSSYKLERPVFGGRTSRAVGIAYRLGRAARVRLTVLRGTRAVRRFATVSRRAHRTYRLRFDAAGRPIGDYKVRLTAVDAAGRSVTATLTTRRL
jgi:hypothetical protein